MVKVKTTGSKKLRSRSSARRRGPRNGGRPPVKEREVHTARNEGGERGRGCTPTSPDRRQREMQSVLTVIYNDKSMHNATAALLTSMEPWRSRRHARTTLFAGVPLVAYQGGGFLSKAAVRLGSRGIGPRDKRSRKRVEDSSKALFRHQILIPRMWPNGCP